MKNTQPIVFTDLDGTFLDHETYDYTPTLPTLKRLKSYGIVIVPVTSKTSAELEALKLPFDNVLQIAENGMVIDIGGVVHTPGPDYEQIIKFVTALPKMLRKHFQGFNDMSTQEIMQHTGLDQASAQAAKTRLASEPFLWGGTKEEMFELSELATNRSLKVTRGGRFYHLMGEGGKNTAITWVLEKLNNKNLVSIALGDGPNDADMLAVADYGIIIPNPHGASFSVQNPKGKILTAPVPGPVGWSAALGMVLDEWEQNR